MVTFHVFCLKNGYPAWIRTMTKGFKDPCATFTPPSNSRNGWHPREPRVNHGRGSSGKLEMSRIPLARQFWLCRGTSRLFLGPTFRKSTRAPWIMRSDTAAGNEGPPCFKGLLSVKTLRLPLTHSSENELQNPHPPPLLPRRHGRAVPALKP